MRDVEAYGLLKEEEWEYFPWIPDPRPPFEIWVKPEEISPFFIVPHHPYAVSLLLKINTAFKADIFHKLGQTGSSRDWEVLTGELIKEYEENNSGTGMFHFDSDEDVFCVFSQYIDDLMVLGKMLRAVCDDEERMCSYLHKGSETAAGKDTDSN